jgi:hypothetical protein
MPKMMMDAERNELYFREFREECPMRAKSKFYCRMIDCRCEEDGSKQCPLFAMYKFTARKLQS